MAALLVLVAVRGLFGSVRSVTGRETGEMGQQLLFRVAVLSVVRALARALQPSDLVRSRIARMPRQWAAGEYVWRQLANDLSARIADGTYPLGSPLPGEEELASEYAVACVTVRRALAELRKRKLIKNLYGLRNAVVAMPGPGGLPG